MKLLYKSHSDLPEWARLELLESAVFWLRIAVCVFGIEILALCYFIY